jgi:hypothetical protein
VLLILTLIRLGDTTDMLVVCDRGRNHLFILIPGVKRHIYGGHCMDRLETRNGNDAHMCRVPGAAVARQAAVCRDRGSPSRSRQYRQQRPILPIKSNLSNRPSPTPRPRSGFAARSVCLGLRLRASPLPCRARVLY